MKMTDIMKRLAEINARTPGVVNESVAGQHNMPPLASGIVSEVSHDGDHEFEMYIINPAFIEWEGGAGDENVIPEEELRIRVTYNVSGKHRPATWGYRGGDPAESPEIEIATIYNADTEEDITKRINQKTLNAITQQAYEEMYKNKRMADESMGAQGDNDHGAHGEETTSPIHGQTKELPPMENLNLESLRYLAGVKETIAECGIGMLSPSSPASISMTAASGPELSGMLRDIMSLAGVTPVTQRDMPIDHSAAPAVVDVDDSGHEPSMKDLISVIDEPDEEPAGPDSMNGDDREEEETDEDFVKSREYSNSPDEEIGQDGVQKFGDINNNFQNALVGRNVKETTAESLYAEYQKFVAEGSNYRQNYTPDPAKKSGLGSKLANVAKKVGKAITGPGDDELLDRLAKSSGGTRPTKEGKDEGKPGKNFAKIAKTASKEYGSKEAGKRVAGEVRNKLKKQGKL